MKINFNEIPKFVINLERRPDRLETVTKEFEYMGWTFERFNAVDTNSYEGCAYSHQQIAKIILERGYEYAMVFAALALRFVTRPISEPQWLFCLCPDHP